MIGVTYAVAERRPLEATLRTVGIVEPEAERVFEYVARVEGYVDKLAVSSPGQMVKKGEALLTIYSPDLLATEQELLEMLRTLRQLGPAYGVGQAASQALERQR